MIPLSSLAQLVPQRIYELARGGGAPRELDFHGDFRTITDPKAVLALDFSSVGNEASSVAERVASGEVLGIFVRGNTVLARGLIRLSGNITIEGHRNFRSLSQHEAFLHFFRTAEEARGQGLYPKLIRFLLGFDSITNRVALISCREDNLASIKGIERAGGRLVLKTMTFGLLGGRIAHTWARHSHQEGNG